MKITGAAIIIGAAVAIGGYIAYKVIEEEKEKAREFKEHKDNKLKDRDLEKEIQDASLNNDIFDSDDRAKAYEILDNDRKALERCEKSIDIFDERLKHFDRRLKEYTDENRSRDSRIAAVIVTYDKLKKIQERKRIAKEQAFEKEKIALFAKTLSSNFKDVNNLVRDIDHILKTNQFKWR